MKIFTTTRAQSRGVQAAGRAPLMEGLEVRRLMAAEPPVPMIDDLGVLQVAGTNKNDVIVLSMDNSVEGAPRIVVQLNDATHSFALGDVTGGVVVRGKSGSDDVSLDERFARFAAAVTMYGGNGQDRLVGGEGLDTLYGCNGQDRLDGAAGADMLYGGNGIDDLEGGDGVDHLYGGNGRDDLKGGDGADMLFAGLGVDRLTGGAGADAFTCKASEIVDMTEAEGDKTEAPVTTDGDKK